MKIKSNASPSEFSSPFYKANEDFCSVFESYIASHSGMVKGEYNAWSYLIFGKFESSKQWRLMYKKSSLTSGNLFLPDDQGLLTMATWTTKLPYNKDLICTIRKRKTLDFIWLPFNKNLIKLNQSNNYVLKSNTSLTKEINIIINILKPLFEIENIYEIHLKNNELTIDLRSKLHHFDFLDEIIKQVP